MKLEDVLLTCDGNQMSQPSNLQAGAVVNNVKKWFAQQIWKWKTNTSGRSSRLLVGSGVKIIVQTRP